MNLLKVQVFLACCLVMPSLFGQNPFKKYKPVTSSVEDFIKTENIFEMNNQSFETDWLDKFALDWTDRFKRSARGTSKVKFHGVEASETIFKFHKNKFNKITMMVYNQGDQGVTTEKRFMDKVKATYETLNKAIGVKSGFKPGNKKLANKNIYFWVKLPYLYRLEFSSSMVKPAGNKFAAPKFKPEYIRVLVSKGDKRITAVNVDQIGLKDVLNGAEIKAMVTEDDYGGVFVDGVPMVDQGQKGYCACATTARILNFYGRDIDQHDIAKMALSSGDGGTDPDELKKAITRITAKLRLNMKTVVRCPIGSMKDYYRLWTHIERTCKKEGIPIQKDPYGGRSVERSDLTQIFAKMSEKDSRYKTFFKGVKSGIDNGKPLAWALMLGMVIEEDIPQAEGGHMRLIIGYNESTEEIYYSDSWGKGHELKKMKAYEAYYTSMAVWEISPR